MNTRVISFRDALIGSFFTGSFIFVASMFRGYPFWMAVHRGLGLFLSIFFIFFLMETFLEANNGRDGEFHAGVTVALGLFSSVGWVCKGNWIGLVYGILVLIFLFMLLAMSKEGGDFWSIAGHDFSKWKTLRSIRIEKELSEKHALETQKKALESQRELQKPGRKVEI